MAGLAAAGAAKSMGAIVRGFDTRYLTFTQVHFWFIHPHHHSNHLDLCSEDNRKSDSRQALIWVERNRAFHLACLLLRIYLH